MFAEFLNIVFSSLKLDRNLYRNSKNFGEAAIYFAGLIMILDGVAGAVAANTFIKNINWNFRFYCNFHLVSVGYIYLRYRC